MKEIILASASPRRKELLEQIGLSFQVIVSDCEEIITSTKPSDVVLELSALKCKDVVEKLLKNDSNALQNQIVIGADTVVAVDEHILGKPVDVEDSICMIKLLQNNVHQVYTGVTIGYSDSMGQPQFISFYEATDVTVCPMNEEEIIEYANGSEPKDKAGSYAIQGLFAKYITKIDGDYNNVVGLPTAALYHTLKELL